MRPFPDYLRRKGYRLPTEAEWEFACRAGSDSVRFFGHTAELLPRYAWFQDNSRNRFWISGQKRPNDLGLFDMYGNVWQWCDGPWSEQLPPPFVIDREETGDVVATLNRHTRGSSFVSSAFNCRSAIRTQTAPTMRSIQVGLRVARTCE